MQAARLFRLFWTIFSYLHEIQRAIRFRFIPAAPSTIADFFADTTEQMYKPRRHETQRSHDRLQQQQHASAVVAGGGGTGAGAPAADYRVSANDYRVSAWAPDRPIGRLSDFVPEAERLMTESQRAPSGKMALFGG